MDAIQKTVRGIGGGAGGGGNDIIVVPPKWFGPSRLPLCEACNVIGDCLPGQCMPWRLLLFDSRQFSLSQIFLRLSI